MRTMRTLPLLLGAVLGAGCNTLDITDLNNPGLDGLQNNPSRSGVIAAATGLLIGTRSGIASQNGYVSLLGIVGRESYNFDPADPRFVTEMLIGPLDGGSPAFGGNLFGSPYANIRNANILLHAVDNVVGMTDAEKEATRGFTQTIQALDFLNVINTRDEHGAPVDVDIDPTAPPGPIVSKAEVFTRIIALLDGGQTHLQAGGAAFPFPLSTGFTGFNTPATFLTFNRALRARVAVYTQDYTGALAALGLSFVNTGPGASLSLGVYHVFSTASGDSTNQLFDPNARALFAHPSIRTDAQLRADATPDLRFQQKLTQITPAKVVQGITTDLVFNIYRSNADPVPIIRNEELILLRAEANLGLGDVTAALSDIDFIRVNSGGLPPYTGALTPEAVLDELLYNKRYSLLFEGGHRWIDLRRYGRLGDLPLDLPTHKRFTAFPFPINECLARDPQPSGCSPEAGS